MQTKVACINGRRCRKRNDNFTDYRYHLSDSHKIDSTRVLNGKKRPAVPVRLTGEIHVAAYRKLIVAIIILANQ